MTDVLIIEHKIDFAQYMENIGNSKFTLCPVGNGFISPKLYLWAQYPLWKIHCSLQ